MPLHFMGRAEFDETPPQSTSSAKRTRPSRAFGPIQERCVNLREFKCSGHWPSLLCALLYFDSSFAVWTLMGALGIFIAQTFHLSSAQKG